MKKSKLLGMRDPLLAIALIAVLPSCQRTGHQDTASASDNIAALQQAIALTTGASPENVVYVKKEKQFIVEDDGYITLEDARMRFGNANSTPGSASGSSQRITYFLVNSLKVSSIKIYAEYTVPDAWCNALDAAIDNWNQLGSNVRMERTNNSYEANTRVSTFCNPFTYTVAMSNYPSYYGLPGRKITINTHYNNMNEPKKIFVLTHELGHALGFSHTNGYYGTLIQDTPLFDSYSVMNSVCTGWNGFSDYDVKAINSVYPSAVQPEEPEIPVEPEENPDEPTP